MANYVRLCVRPSVHPSVRLSVRPSVRLSVPPSLRRSVRLSVRTKGFICHNLLSNAHGINVNCQTQLIEFD